MSKRFKMNCYCLLIIPFMISSLVAMDQHQKELSEKEKTISQTQTNSDQLLDKMMPDLINVAAEIAQKYKDRTPQNIKNTAKK